MQNYSARKSCQHGNFLGFTLIELLIVVVLLGILGGLALTVISPGKQQKIAEDSVRRSNIEKLSQAIGSFCSVEGGCPTAAQISSSTSPPVSIYVSKWPTSNFSSISADNVYSYYPNDNSATPKYFEVSVKMMSSVPTTKYLRYNSSWGQIMMCTDVISGNFTLPVSTTNCTL